MKPGDLVKTDACLLVRKDNYFEFFHDDLYTRSGGIFHDDDVGLVLEMKVDVLSFCRVLTPRGNGWITESRLEKVK